jgi:molecular chaperone DnaK
LKRRENAELKKVKDSDKLDEIKKKMEELSAVAQKIGAAMYQQAQGAQGGTGAGGAQGGAQPGDKKKEEGPIEGEFTEKK